MTHHPENHTDDAFLDALLTQARDTPVAVPSSLVARVLADAAKAHPRAIPAAPSVRALLADLFGGRLGLAGIGFASAFGLFLGFAQPFDLLPEGAAFDLLPTAEGLIALLEAGA